MLEVWLRAVTRTPAVVPTERRTGIRSGGLPINTTISGDQPTFGGTALDAIVREFAPSAGAATAVANSFCRQPLRSMKASRTGYGAQRIYVPPSVAALKMHPCSTRDLRRVVDLTPTS
jgi:hypothetical protein